MGNPHVVGAMVAAGIVAGEGGDMRDGSYGRFLQIDAPSVGFGARRLCCRHRLLQLETLSSETTGFPFERKHWCRCQTQRDERATQPPLRLLADPGLVLVRARIVRASRMREGLDHERQTYRCATCDAECGSAARGPLLDRAGQDERRDSHQISEKLVKLGLVREVRAKAGMPAWRRDDAGRATRSN